LHGIGAARAFSVDEPAGNIRRGRKEAERDRYVLDRRGGGRNLLISTGAPLPACSAALPSARRLSCATDFRSPDETTPIFPTRCDRRRAMTEQTASLAAGRGLPRTPTLLGRMTAWRAANPLVFGLSAGLTFAALAYVLRLVLLGPTASLAYLTFYPSVCLAALVAGLRGGCAAALASVALVHLRINPIDERLDVLALSVFLVSALLVSWLAEALLRAQTRTLRLEAGDVLQRNLSQIVETSLEAIYSVDPEGRVLTWNRGAELLYGWSASEMVGQSIAIVAPDESRDDLLRLRQFARRGEPVVNFETTRRRRDGVLIDVEISASPIRSPSGAAIAMSVIARDVSDRKRTEDALRAALLRIEAKFENAAVGMADVGADGAWLRVNQKLCSILGYSGEELLGKSFTTITHPDDVPENLANLGAMKAGRIETFAMEKRYIRKDGSIVWTNLTVGNVLKPDGAFDHFLAIVEDITERKQGEARIRLLMGEVNHRANNLLAVVQSIAQQTANTSDIKTYVAELRDRIQGLAASQRLLVDNEWRGTDLRALAQAQLAMFANLIGSRIVLEGPPIQLNAAATQGIGMALHELATNAAKYGALSNARGAVAIRWSVDGDAFVMTWQETGGPPVARPQRRGFGQFVIGRMAEAAVGGKAEIDYAPKGVRWTLRGSAQAIAEGAQRKRENPPRTIAAS
jgi:PAS domain S-box-containing protein